MSPKPLTAAAAVRKALAAQQKAEADAAARAFLALCARAGLPAPVRELRFARGRRWRFDFAWKPERLALEVEGGVWTEGRHTRGSGFLRDMEKYNRAAADGWRLIRCTPDTLLTPATLQLVRACLTPTPGRRS